MRRPFSANGVRFSPAPDTAIGGSAGSYADIVRRGETAFLYCDDCIPPITIKVDFRDWPWRRYLNYPADVKFRCPGCGGRIRMHLQGGTGIPFTARFLEKSSD